jgi:hypothetical protein
VFFVPYVVNHIFPKQLDQQTQIDADSDSDPDAMILDTGDTR